MSFQFPFLFLSSIIFCSSFFILFYFTLSHGIFYSFISNGTWYLKITRGSSRYSVFAIKYWLPTNGYFLFCYFCTHAWIVLLCNKLNVMTWKGILLDFSEYLVSYHKVVISKLVLQVITSECHQNCSFEPDEVIHRK